MEKNGYIEMKTFRLTAIRFHPYGPLPIRLKKITKTECGSIDLELSSFTEDSVFLERR